jgi:hypothetical protein
LSFFFAQLFTEMGVWLRLEALLDQNLHLLLNGFAQDLVAGERYIANLEDPPWRERFKEVAASLISKVMMMTRARFVRSRSHPI